ncbi:MAG: hypothetical protein HC932_05575 [Thermales bacterium]|nr:hypothetical protein [Thermales bacterium]
MNTQCGLNLYGEANNGNTELETVYRAGFNFNTNPCPDYNKIEEKRQVQETQRTKIIGQTSAINTCIQARTIAIQQKQDPNKICNVPDMMNSDLFK